MPVALMVLGYLIAACAAVICTVAVVVVAWFVLVGFRDRRDALVTDLERRRIGVQLADAAWWFSEDPVTMALLQDLAENLKRSGDIYGDVSTIRDRWRQSRAAAA